MNNENPVLITLSSLIFFAAVTLAQTPESRQSSLPDGAVAHRDVAYVPSGHERQRLDLYLPRDGTTLPLIINIHGGAFKMGSKEQGVPLEYLTQGYAVASINYRLSQHAKFPAQIEDCKAAVRWLRAHAAEYRLDANRFAAWGSSAGGHLAAMLGTTGDTKEFDVGANLDQSSRVQAVVDYFGPTDFLQMDAHRLASGMRHDPADSPESELIGGAIQENKDKVAKANPIAYVTPGDPPFLICHGDADPLVPHHQSELLEAALQKGGVPVTFYTVKGAGHGGFKDPKVPEMTYAFLATCLNHHLAERPAAPKNVESLDDCNVTWNSPSGDSFGSMPLGNGDLGANVWVENNGDLVFYLSKVDAFDAGHLQPKLGRVRLRLSPALDVNDFQQKLVLRQAVIELKAGDTQLRVWVDANQPVAHVQGSSATPHQATLTFESLRPMQEHNKPLPGNGTVGVLFRDNQDRLAWCYRNQSSAWAEHLGAQNSAELTVRVKDPILHRTAGGILRAANFKRSAPDALVSERPLTALDCSVRVLCGQPESLEAWLAEAERPLPSDWAAHRKYWEGFWNRSHIFVSRCGERKLSLDQCRFTQFPQGSKAYQSRKEIGAALNAFQISQRYALERFCQAAASGGEVPPPYNGSIFTMDMPAGVMGFDTPKPHAVSPDGRDWAELSFMWQNTRHPYWSMPARGDYDTLVPGMAFVRDGLEIGRDRCRKLLGLDGAFIMEASWWHNVGVFNWDGMPAHLRYHQLATVELPAIMAETYEHTRDAGFLNEVLLPCAEAGIDYYANRFTRRDTRGKMLMAGVGCAETYQGVNNPCTEIGCLKYLLTKLLSFEIDAARRSKWRQLLEAMPGVPLRRIRGIDLLAVGDAYDPGREICESPELYSIYPFRQVWLGQPELLANARQSFHVRNISLDGTDDKQAVETGGWQSAPVQAAYLGLAREAARLASINFNDQFIHWTDNVEPSAPFPQRPRARFPAFWECKMDGTPDNDHGANSVNALQAMLLQSDGKRIFLLPSWPEDWDVDFRLMTAFNTTVECVYRNGKVQSLNVIPVSRRNDLIDLSTPEQRIRTLVEVACADRNWVFGLPPMLDGVPKPGPVTTPWLEKFGESVSDVKGAPWPDCVFRDKVLYVHGGSDAPAIPAKVVSSKRLSDRILKVEYERPLEPLALAAVSAASLTAGKTGTTLDLGQPATFDRLEFTIDNPSHRRGQSKPFELQVSQADGQWKTVHQGRVFGSIYSKRFKPVTAQSVRLVIHAPVRQFDLFSQGR